MSSLRSRRPSLALIVALLALAIAMSGTAYSVSKVSGNSLIKKNSLSGNRLKKNSVGGKQVKESKLGTVPHATTADTLPAPALNALPLAPRWSNNTSFNHRPPGFRKDASGFVHLEGAVSATNGQGYPIGYLPPGYRPNAQMFFQVPTYSGTTGQVAISSDGTIQYGAGGDTTLVYLEGITFYANQ